MDNINKIISFVLGLVVIAIFLVILSGRLQLKERFLAASRGESLTPTPTAVQESEQANLSPTQSTTPAAVAKNTTPTPTRSVDSVNTIPDTGAGTSLLLFSFIGGGVGIVLRKSS